MGTSSRSMNASIDASSSVTSAGMVRSKSRHSFWRWRRAAGAAATVDYRVRMSVRAIGINHIAFEVRDLDEALEWWKRWFAFELRGRRRTMAFIDLGDQFVALSQVGAGAAGSGDADAARHVGLVVDDKEALRTALRDAWVRPSMPRGRCASPIRAGT